MTEPHVGTGRADEDPGGVWPANHLTVEPDGFRFHATRHAWERDRQREREAYTRGDQFRRYTYGDVVEHPAAMLEELRGLLGSGQTSTTTGRISGRRLSSS